jgi:hypothetical protein
MYRGNEHLLGENGKRATNEKSKKGGRVETNPVLTRPMGCLMTFLKIPKSVYGGFFPTSSYTVFYNLVM